MLQSLRIRNLALLEEVTLDFDRGFTAVTGETGAGKSILLGALSLLAGSRAEKTVIRQGAAACEVEAALLFDDSRKVDSLLASLDLPACEDGVLILKRSLARDKAPKITVNGGLATLAALQSLGELWIDFHGPGEPRRLLKEAAQLELLDLFGRTSGRLAEYQESFRAWRALAAIAADPAAHPQARQQATEKLQQLWPVLSLGERRSLAHHVPRQLWALVWKAPATTVLEAFLQHPKLGLEPLIALIQPPLRPPQADALALSRWHELGPVAEQVLQALDQSLTLPDSGLALGHAAPWIKALDDEARILMASRIQTPALRRMVHPRRD